MGDKKWKKKSRTEPYVEKGKRKKKPKKNRKRTCGQAISSKKTDGCI